MPRRLAAEPQMTVESALRVPALRRGEPQVLAGRDALRRPVRWAHSCEARHIPDLLEGDELLLMTGLGLASAPGELQTFVRALVERRVAALVIELGRVYSALPDALVREARRLHLPLVVLEQEVRFVDVTKQLHTAILSRQMTLEHSVAELQRVLTEQLLDGAGVAEVLEALAHALGNPVLLERGDGELLFHASGTSDTEELLAQWRLLREAPEDESGAAFATLHEAGRRPWGRLVVLPLERPVDGAARLAAARVAPLVALVLVRVRGEERLEVRERGNFLHDVLTGRIAPGDVPAHAAALGAELHGGRLLAFAVATRSARRPGTDRAPVLGAAAALREALRTRGLESLLGARPGHDDLLVVTAVPAGLGRPEVLEQVAGAVGELLGPGAATLAAGPVADGWEALPSALGAAIETADTMRDSPPRALHDATVPDVERLLWALRGQEPLAAFADGRLAAILEHDRTHAAKLLPTLRALGDGHWHKAEAARALGIRRQSLYARIARLERLLDADLDDPETRLGLDLALRARAVLAT